MKEMTKVVLDAMGGDNAPREIIKGAVEAVQKRDDIHVILTGKEDVINKELSGYTYNKEQISVVHAEEIIETAEPPVMAIRRRRFFHCSWYEAGKGWNSRCFCVGRKFRSCSGWRSAFGR